jgi:hypothetical protein
VGWLSLLLAFILQTPKLGLEKVSQDLKFMFLIIK